MKKTIINTCIITIVLGLAGTVFSNNRTDDPLGVAVSPQTLLLGCDQGGYVVVHTKIPYGSVDRTSLELIGVAVSWTKFDDCGNLVAYFDEDAVKAIVTPPTEVMTLTGVLKNGVPFEGSDPVRVIQR
jgi:hypothetical protein